MRENPYPSCMLPYLLGAFAGCFVLERLVPGWSLPRVKTWPFRVVLVNLVQLGVILLAGLTWERWLSSASIFHFARMAIALCRRDARILYRDVRLLLVAS